MHIAIFLYHDATLVDSGHRCLLNTLLQQHANADPGNHLLLYVVFIAAYQWLAVAYFVARPFCWLLLVTFSKYRMT